MRFKTHLELREASDEGRYDEYIEKSSLKTRLEIMDSRKDVYPLSKTPEPDRVKKMGEKYNLYTNILNMSLGQFIMLEGELKSDQTRDDLVARLVIRPKTEKDYSNDNPEEEDRILNEILEEDVRDIHSVISSMMLNRDFILFTKFNGVIYNKVEEEEEEEEEEEDENNDLIDDQAFNDQWFWYRIVRQLAKEDITRFDEIYEIKMSVAMVELSFLSQKAILENARARAEESRQRAAIRR